MPATKIVVNIPDEASYAARVGVDVLDGLGAALRQLPAVAAAPRLLVISDDNVAPLYLDAEIGRAHV